MYLAIVSPGKSCKASSAKRPSDANAGTNPTSSAYVARGSSSARAISGSATVGAESNISDSAAPAPISLPRISRSNSAQLTAIATATDHPVRANAATINSEGRALM